MSCESLPIIITKQSLAQIEEADELKGSKYSLNSRDDKFSVKARIIQKGLIHTVSGSNYSYQSNDV